MGVKTMIVETEKNVSFHRAERQGLRQELSHHKTSSPRIKVAANSTEDGWMTDWTQS
jgi:hypothetical protein